MVVLFGWLVFQDRVFGDLAALELKRFPHSLSFLSGRIKGVCLHLLHTIVPESKSPGQRMMLIQVFLTGEVAQPGKTAPTT